MKNAVCDDNGHGYSPMPGERYCKMGCSKKDASYDTSLWFFMLYCSRCGGTLEVVAEDRRWQRSRRK